MIKKYTFYNNGTFDCIEIELPVFKRRTLLEICDELISNETILNISIGQWISIEIERVTKVTFRCVL